jgi:hypothetical protein
MYLILLILITAIYADTINFKNGATLEGKIIEEDDTTVTISIKEKQTIYSMNDIKSIKRDTVVSAPPPPPPSIATPPSGIKEIKAGTLLHITMSTSLDTQRHNKGHQFKARLESDLLTNDGVVVAKKGSDVYGTVLQAKQAGRMVGQSQMMVTFNAISIDGKRVEIKTNTLDIMSKDNQAKDSVKKVARGAIIGAMINGNDGARDGAKVGIGLSMLTRGKGAGIEAGTLFDFTLTSTLTIQ